MTEAVEPPPPVTSTDCTNDTAHRVVKAVNDHFGGVPKNSNQELQQLIFQNQHEMQFFDENNDGFIDLYEYIEIQWSVFIPYLTDNGCKLTRESYIYMNTKDSIKYHDLTVKLWGETFDNLARKMGVSGRGYLTKSDMAKYFTFEFNRIPKKTPGRLTLEELTGVKARPKP
jgi:hypothetical protein